MFEEERVSTNAWMVRAGEGGHHIDDFAKGYVAIGWSEMGDLDALTTLSDVKQRLREAYKDRRGGSFAAAAAVLHKFRSIVARGDSVATYDPPNREYLLGSITSDYRFEPGLVAGYPHIRHVRWKKRARRDHLPSKERSSLGSAYTLFRIPAAVWAAMYEQSSDYEPAGRSIDGDEPTMTIGDRGWRLEDQLARLLEESGFSYRRQPAIGGLRPDFVVRGPGGQSVIIEAKTWLPSPANTARASHQAQQYVAATKADQALIVLAGLKHDLAHAGVVSPERLIDVLHEFFSGRRKKSQPLTHESAAKNRMVFAAMPFDGKYDDTFFIAMRYAAEQIDATCERVDHAQFSGDIVEEIKRLIRVSLAVIVDLSESKQNVLYEAGFAHALNKPVVHICSTDLSLLPFDVRNWNTLAYAVGATNALRDPLAKRLKATLP